MAFYTAIEGTLLNNGKRQHAILDVLTRILYLLLFPSMLIVFVCYELGFTEYALIVPALTIAGVVLLLLGAVSYSCMTLIDWIVRIIKRPIATSVISKRLPSRKWNWKKKHWRSRRKSRKSWN